MKDHSIFQGWKELHGKDGNGAIFFESDGPFWKVWDHTGIHEKHIMIMCGRIEKKNRKSNTKLYDRGMERIDEFWMS